MPLTHRGREILSRVPGGTLQRTAGVGCEILRHEELCVGCGTCAAHCPSGASERSGVFDVNQLLDAPAGSRRGALGDALRRIMRHDPDGPVEVPPRVTVYRTIVYDSERCLGCGTCARVCPAEAIEARPPQADAAPAGHAAAPGKQAAAPSSATPAAALEARA
jgi:coenzyme F420-reducing hydrogenase gamma subunit